MKTKAYIYNLSDSGTPFYVGHTTNPEIRLSDHKVYYSKNIEMEILEEIENDTQVKKEAEKYWIEQLRQWGFKLKNAQHNMNHIPKNKDMVNTVKVNGKISPLLSKELKKLLSKIDRPESYAVREGLKLFITKNKKKL